MSDQGESTSSEEFPPESEGQTAPAWSYDYTFPDGEKMTLNPDNAEKYLRESYFRDKDYRHKTQSLAEQRKQFEEQQKKFEDDMKGFQQTRRQYDEWDQLLRSRPDIYQQLSRAAQGPATPSAVYERSKSYADEKITTLEKEIEKLKKSHEADSIQRELEGVFDQMSSQYRDFDRDAVSGLLEELKEGKTEPLIRALYYANLGMKNPAEVEERIAGNLKKKQSATMVPSGGEHREGPKRRPKDIKEARKLAYEAEGIPIDY